MTRVQGLKKYKGQLIRIVGDLVTSSSPSDRRLCILNYHRVLSTADSLLNSGPDVLAFQWQTETLANCFNVMPIYEGFHALMTGTLPPRAVCITFDDGYKSLHDVALPILKKTNLPATVFVTRGMSQDNNMWNDRILEAVRRLPERDIDLGELGLGKFRIESNQERQYILEVLMERIKYFESEKRKAAVALLESKISASHSSQLMLTAEMIATLSENNIEIGGHTVSHPILANLDEHTALQEIQENKICLENIVNKPLRFFAYPNGKFGKDFNNKHIDVVKQAGYIAAFTTESRTAVCHDDAHRLPRTRPWDKTPFAFAARLLSWLA